MTEKKEKNYDLEREREIYRYLFSLALAIHQGEKKAGDINRTEVTRRILGIKDKSDQEAKDAASSIYKFLTQENHVRSPKYQITTGKLVEYLTNLKRRELPEIFQVVTKEDILIIFQSLVQLSPNERKKLGLTNFDLEILLQQILINITIFPDSLNKEKILKIYKESLGISAYEQNEKQGLELVHNQINKIIKDAVRNFLQEYPDRLIWQKEEKSKLELESYFIQKAIRAIDRIKSKAGVGQNIDLTGDTIEDNFCQKYLPKGLVNKITYTVIENEILNESFPIYIKCFKIEQVNPLPLYLEDHYINREPLLNKEIAEVETIRNVFLPNLEIRLNNGLETGYAYQVTIEFAIHSKNMHYQKLFENDWIRLTQGNKNIVTFSIQSSGVGGQLSQIIRIINKALLWDIKCLNEEYFAVAHDLIIYQKIIQNNIVSPVWSHSLVKLCRLDSIKKALIDTTCNSYRYEDYSYLDKVGRGDYCSFDFLESVGKSALQARLRAIKNTGVLPNKYIHDLLNRIERLEQLKRAKKHLKLYPFSLIVMENQLSDLFKKEKEIESNSEVQYEARIAIAEGYLNEGLYRKADLILQILKNDLEKDSEAGEMLYKKFRNQYRSSPTSLEENFKIKSASLLAKYEICRAKYFYLFDDRKEVKKEYINTNNLTNRTDCIDYSWRCLNRAEIHLKLRLFKYQIINEVSQGIFHPYFFLLAKIYFLRAKIYLFFKKNIQELITLKRIRGNENCGFNSNLNYECIALLEKARSYAACDGDSELYACFTAYQCLAYLVAGYLENKEISIEGRSVNLKKNQCLEWAKKLRDDSLISYAETGRSCYLSLKEKSGTSSPIRFEKCIVVPVPPIVEVNFDNKDLGDKRIQGLLEEKQKSDYQLLYIDLSLLWIEVLKNEENIYLFGSNASVLLFARGMYLLCSDENEDLFSIRSLNLEQRSLNSIDDWKLKVHRAYRLFSYSWAIAENSKNTDNCNIERDFTWYKELQDRFGFEEAISVRDLYPHRITEIADLGKLYAIACNLILIALTVKNEEQDKLINLNNKLQSMFHSSSCSSINQPCQLAENQSRFNGHLSSYFEEAKQIIEDQKDKAKEFSRNLNIDSRDHLDSIKKFRDNLVRKFFSLFGDFS